MRCDRVELETKFTFLERTVAELNEVIYDQQKQLDTLKRQVEKLRAQVDELNEGAGEPLPHVKPPHH